jgi:hypothetical protein
MRVIYGVVVNVLITGLVFGEIKNFWDVRNCVFGNASFSNLEKKFRVEYSIIRTETGAPRENEFCIFDGAKGIFTPLSFYKLTRLEDKRLTLDAPRTVKMLKREVEKMKETGRKQRALEYGYLVPIFMDIIFPKIKPYAAQPEAVLKAVRGREGIVCDVIYPVEVYEDRILISSIVATRKKGEKPGTSLEEQIQWKGGPFEVMWSEVLPEQYKTGVYYEGTKRGASDFKKVRIDYKLLDSLCSFPVYTPPKKEGGLEGWVREAGPYTISNFYWRKDMFNSLMEVGYFASFYAKYIFPRIQKKVEIPSRFKKEGFLVTYFTEAGINGLTVWAQAEGHGEKWVGSKQLITWEDALPQAVKKIVTFKEE